MEHLLNDEQRAAADAIVSRSYCNPFSKRRIELEKRALGRDFKHDRPFIHRPAPLLPDKVFRNTEKLGALAERLLETARTVLITGKDAGDADIELYRDLATYVLYHRFFSGANPEIEALTARPGTTPQRVSVWDDFQRDYQQLLELPGLCIPSLYPAASLFALQFQVARAFAAIYQNIFGGSLPAARLRMAVWESIFTYDMRRYARLLYQRMGEIPTLITGPSGTGKELVARAIGAARYIPFDAVAGRFETTLEPDFHAINITAFSKTLVESELFGHSKGAFTGAVSDRKGWLESCGRYGCVFLDEIGELNESTQVTLLRVLQDRGFQRIGETRQRRFNGKIISATNRDLGSDMQRGHIRADFYYRLCADMVATPSLRQQIDDTPEDLFNLVRHLVGQLLGDSERATGATTQEVMAWIEENLPSDYAWPGNMRELEQCVRNIVIRGEYRPLPVMRSASTGDLRHELGEQVAAGALTLDELQARYCSLLVAETGSYRAAAAQLAADRRTVRTRADDEWVERYRAGVRQRIG